jgi:hypothetical protein
MKSRKTVLGPVLLAAVAQDATTAPVSKKQSSQGVGAAKPNASEQTRTLTEKEKCGYALGVQVSTDIATRLQDLVLQATGQGNDSVALQLMPVGSKWQIFVPSDLAYSERGTRGVIGPNATLIFEVELLSILDKTQDLTKPQGVVTNSQGSL